jgi:predicted AAA+ superfamily ATPase
MNDILLKHNPLWSGDKKPEGVRREILNRLVAAISVRHVVAISGSRRSGKSYLFRQLQHHLLELGVPKENLLEINFEDPYFIHRKEDEKLLNDLYSSYLILKNPKAKKYLFFDEIQNIKGWQYWVRDLYDRDEEVKIFITGSNAELLSVELSSHLTGRVISFENFPFSFSELLKAKGEDFTQSDSMQVLIEKNFKIKEILLHHLEGCFSKSFFPEICVIENEELAQEILRQYFSNVIFKDIVPRFSIRNAKVIEELSYYLSTNFTSEFSANGLAKIVGSNENTIKEYLNYLEKAYLFFTVPHFDFSIKKQIRRDKKTYINDVGLRTATAFQFSPDSGRYIENIVFNHLRRQNSNVYYWKSKAQKEIDFVIQNKGQKIGMNVCYSDDLPDREFQGFVDGMQEDLGLQRNIIISKNKYENISYDGVQIEIVPIWAFLLKTNIFE